MYQRFVRAAHHADKDAGIGMIMVIGLSVVMMIIVGVLMTIVQNSLAGSHRHDDFDSALTAAESGIDQTLARLQRDYVNFGANYVTGQTGTKIDPSPVCTTTPPNPTLPFASSDAERSYAKSAIATVLAADPTCLQHSNYGDFMAIRPSNEQVVYSEGWSPSYGAKNATARLIKSEYLFAPYAPSDAVLTGCNLSLLSSVSVTTTAEAASPTEAQVHSNCKITTQGNSTTVTGLVSSSDPSSDTCGKCSSPPNLAGGAISNTPDESIPSTTAAEIYSENATTGSAVGGWYDMCVVNGAGVVEAPSSNGPCTGTVEPFTPDSRGFSFSNVDGSGVAQWTFSKTVDPGTYYFNHADISPGGGIGNATADNVTIIASSLDTTVCPRVGGNVDWEHTDITGTSLPGLFIMGDGMVTSSSNFNAGTDSDGNPSSGGVLAGEQFTLTTSSSVLVGSLIAEDSCTTGTTNSIKGQSITYDPNLKLPFTNVIDSTLWLEYPGAN